MTHLVETRGEEKGWARGSVTRSLPWYRLAACAGFVVAAIVYGLLRDGAASALLAAAAGFGAYMALNIGANDVANNVGPAVGSRVLTLGGALTIAAIFEAAGAIIAGGDVIGTIRNGIIDPGLIPDPETFVWLMMAALLAAALWLNLASALGAPVSTTHSIVGGVLGAGIAAAGFGVVNWGVMGGIAASWVLSPLLGAAISAVLLYLVNRSIIDRGDAREAARRLVPVMVAAMAWAFATYLMLKGLAKVWPVGIITAMALGLVAAVAAWLATRRLVATRIDEQRSGRSAVNRLLAVPLAFAAALLSFAHGSNDVANAIGPVAAIVDVVSGSGEIGAAAPVPFWVVVIGAAGIALGLALFGARIIRTVGSELTRLDPTRAYCIAMAAALTVIAASQLGLPVSTTHVSVGAVLGVGFLREFLRANYERAIVEIRAHHPPGDAVAINDFMARFTAASVPERRTMLRDLKQEWRESNGNRPVLRKRDRKLLKKEYKRELVKRSLLARIVAAWLITVPATALAAAMIFFMLRGMLLR